MLWSIKKKICRLEATTSTKQSSGDNSAISTNDGAYEHKHFREKYQPSS